MPLLRAKPTSKFVKVNRNGPYGVLRQQENCYTNLNISMHFVIYFVDQAMKKARALKPNKTFRNKIKRRK